MEEIRNLTTKDTEGTEEAKSLWLAGVRHGTMAGIDLAIQVLTEFKEEILKRLEAQAAESTEEAK
jgi:hypothetical protein